MKDVLVCKTCLITNVKMFHLDTLANVYSELTGLECDDKTTEYVCYECAALLLKYQQFRTKCLKANQVISEFVGKYCKITEKHLNTIDRKLHNLETTINKFEIKENIFYEIYNEFKDKCRKEVELYDKNLVVSDENESLHLEYDIHLDNDDEIIEIKEKRGQPGNKLKHESVEERVQTKSGRKYDNSYMEEYVTIVNLTPEEAKEEVLLRKESSNYKTNIYKCDLCYRGYGTLKTYENHMKKHNKEIGELECGYCYIRFSQKKYLCRHRLACHSRKFSCKLCPYSCFIYRQAQAHMNVHKGKKYPCQECDQIFNMAHSLAMHQRLKHLSCEFVCALCGTIFGKERGLSLHINLLHKQETNEQKGPLCEECNVHFATETAWKKHLVLSSKHTVSNGCEVCGETYESEEALKRHARVHGRDINRMIESRSPIKKPIDCNLCSKTLVGKMKYFAHMRTDHPEVAVKLKTRASGSELQCDVCGKVFETQSVYLYHQKVHSNERPYSCAECGKSFKLKYLLKVHLATHSSVRAYKCNQCPKTFVFRSSLDKHLKVHLGIRPHKCNICDKSFPTPCQVKYHTQYVHQKLPWPKRDRSKRNKNKSARQSSPEIS